MKRQKALCAALLLVVGIAVPSPALSSSSTGMGIVCIAAVPRPTEGSASLANPSGGASLHTFSVQIDKGEVVELPFETHIVYPQLDLTRRHLVIIRQQRRIVHSFWFTFKAFRTSTLCLWYKPLYGTWSLWEQTESAHLCKCET